MGGGDADTAVGTGLTDRLVAAPAAADADLVLAALAALEPLDREVVALRYREQLGLDAIAARTGATRGAVVQRLRRGALAVEQATGDSVAMASRGPSRDEEEVLADLRIGITPQLASRLAAALAVGDVPLPVRPGARRQLALRAWVHRHMTQLLNVAVVVAGGLVTTAAIVTAV